MARAACWLLLEVAWASLAYQIAPSLLQRDSSEDPTPMGDLHSIVTKILHVPYKAKAHTKEKGVGKNI